MAVKTATKTKPIVIDASETDRKVTIVPKDQDRFVQGVPDVVAACHLYQELCKNRATFFEGFIPRLAAWVHEHEDEVVEAYLAPRAMGLLFLVICRDVFDQAFEDQVTELDVELHRKFPQIPLDVLEIPEVKKDALAAFLTGDVPVFQFEIE